jgi:hypothetical protein
MGPPARESEKSHATPNGSYTESTTLLCRLGTDAVQDFAEFDGEPRTFLHMTGGEVVGPGSVLCALLGVAHGNHKLIEVFAHQQAAQFAVTARAFEQFVSHRDKLTHR